jgi:hypothetical protein
MVDSGSTIAACTPSGKTTKGARALYHFGTLSGTLSTVLLAQVWPQEC